MHEGRRPSCISFYLNAARAEPARAGDTRRPKAATGRILAIGPGGGTGRLPGELGCDILELRIWYKTRGTAAGLALPDVCAQRILFF